MPHLEQSSKLDLLRYVAKWVALATVVAALAGSASALLAAQAAHLRERVWWCSPWAALAHVAPDRIAASTNDTESGEVAEWSNVLDSKSSVGATLPRVRIPPSPPSLKST